MDSGPFTGATPANKELNIKLEVDINPETEISNYFLKCIWLHFLGDKQFFKTISIKRYKLLIGVIWIAVRSEELPLLIRN